MNKKAFTLLELLVVVLIIGILAAIALPQYRMAVTKARFAELKTVTRSLAGATQRYYLTNDAYPASLSSLDIEMPDTVSCFSYSDTLIRCCKVISGTNMCYYVYLSGKPQCCLIYSKDEGDIANKLSPSLIYG